MGGDFSGLIYGWFVAVLAIGAISSVFMIVAPQTFIDVQRRLCDAIGFPTDLLEPAWKKMPLRVMAAGYLPICIAGLYYLLVVNPDLFKN